jgi:hypothetical protein
MPESAVDLFEDPPWSTGVAVERPIVYSPRPVLVVSLLLVVVFLSSMALPWFSLAQESKWTPFSRWLDQGWSSGTQKWGFLVLALGAVEALAIGAAIRAPKKTRMSLLLAIATILVSATLLEARARPLYGDGPHLQAAYGAWVGGIAAVLAWIGIAVATSLSHRPNFSQSRRE